eukprot:scaffold41696_cov53-Attheya_sp.AAC.2
MLSAHNLADLESSDGLGLELEDDDNKTPLTNNVQVTAEERRALFPPLNQLHHSYSPYYGTTTHNQKSSLEHSTLRFQVVVWYVGPVDVMQGTVTMKFRVTLFWNDPESINLPGSRGADGDEQQQLQSPTIASTAGMSHWVMQGRQRAIEHQIGSQAHFVGRAVDVPPISIINAVSFDVIGQPEVSLLRRNSGLMTWSCLYNAVLLQNDLRVDKFPHDEHFLRLKFGILVHRREGGRWDRRTWKLGLASERDSQGSTRIPHGLMVDHVKVPSFTYDKAKGLDFHFVPLGYGAGSTGDDELCLEVKLKVYRESSYYDANIMPILVILDVVAVSFLWLDAEAFFQRGLLLLNIAFLEIGIRMTVDSYLPSVGYQIKMQTILNTFFYRLLCLTLESAGVYYLVTRNDWTNEEANRLDSVSAVAALLLTCVTLSVYYRDKKGPLNTDK